MIHTKINNKNETIINKLRSILDKNKYLRLGQLISNSLQSKYGSPTFDPGRLESELFYIDDDKLLSIIEDYLLNSIAIDPEE
jgi:hypothetical protein